MSTTIWAVHDLIALRYGGGFFAGSSSMYNGSFIVAQSVVRVSKTSFFVKTASSMEHGREHHSSM